MLRNVASLVIVWSATRLSVRNVSRDIGRSISRESACCPQPTAPKAALCAPPTSALPAHKVTLSKPNAQPAHLCTLKTHRESAKEFNPTAQLIPIAYSVWLESA